MKIKTQYSLKEVRILREKAAADTLYIVAAVLSDKHKFNEKKILDFISDVRFAANSKDVNMQEIKDIMKKNLEEKK